MNECAQLFDELVERFVLGVGNFIHPKIALFLFHDFWLFELFV
jgi:hypothetical protein